jgi:hypothetical protein
MPTLHDPAARAALHERLAALRPDAPDDFARDVAELGSLLDRFAAADPAALHPHPVFGRLSRGEWGRWAWRHTDHHLRQFGA